MKRTPTARLAEFLGLTTARPRNERLAAPGATCTLSWDHYSAGLADVMVVHGGLTEKILPKNFFPKNRERVSVGGPYQQKGERAYIRLRVGVGLETLRGPIEALDCRFLPRFRDPTEALATIG